MANLQVAAVERTVKVLPCGRHCVVWMVDPSCYVCRLCKDGMGLCTSVMDRAASLEQSLQESRWVSL